MNPLHISNLTQNTQTVEKSVIIHITKPHSFIFSAVSIVSIQVSIQVVMLLLSITATRFAQLSQKRACPQGTCSANPSRGATKHTSQVMSAAASAAVCGAVDVVVGVAAVDWPSSPSSLSLSAGCNAAV